MNALPSGWSRRTLSELQARKRWALNGGPFGSKLVQRDYVDIGVPVIRGCNLPIEAKFSHDNLVYVSEEKADELRANNAYPGDVIFTQRGTLGQVGLIPKKAPYPRYVISQSQMKMTVDEGQVVPEWIYYYFTEASTVVRLVNQAFSSGVPHINLGILREFQVDIPPLPTQRKIAAILSAYDDLIENNLRRIKILEEMAQNLYREWFVKFRFPGHEKVKMVDSPIGRIPEGWEVAKLGDVCHLIMGQSPKSEFYNTNRIGLPFHQGVTYFGHRFPAEGLYCSIEGRTAQRGDILFSVRAPVGRINIATSTTVIGRGLSAIRHRAGHQWYAYHLLKENFKEEDTIGSGTIFKSVTKGDMERIAIILPEEPFEQQFERIVQPSEADIENLTSRNTTLRQTRDLLLPRLISGELDVSDLNITIPEDNP